MGCWRAVEGPNDLAVLALLARRHNVGHIVGDDPGRTDSSKILFRRGTMRGLGSGSFDPKTLATLETAFDEAWLTLRCNGNDKVRANELARCILRLASEGERDAVRLHDHALAALAPAMVWREAQLSEFMKDVVHAACMRHGAP